MPDGARNARRILLPLDGPGPELERLLSIQLPVLVQMNRDDQLNVQNVPRALQRTVVEVGVVLERRTDQVNSLASPVVLSPVVSSRSSLSAGAAGVGSGCYVRNPALAAITTTTASPERAQRSSAAIRISDIDHLKSASTMVCAFGSTKTTAGEPSARFASISQPLQVCRTLLVNE
jgi:hypothetical protein